MATSCWSVFSNKACQCFRSALTATYGASLAVDSARVAQRRRRCIQARQPQLQGSHLHSEGVLQGQMRHRPLQMRFPEAVSMHQEALRIFAHIGHETIEVAGSMSNLALLFYRYTDDELDEAETLYREAMRIQELRVGHDSSQVATTLSNLCLLHEKQERAWPTQKPHTVQRSVSLS